MDDDAKAQDDVALRLVWNITYHKHENMMIYGCWLRWVHLWMTIMTHTNNDICTWNMMEYDHVCVWKNCYIYVCVCVMCDGKRHTSIVHTSVESGGGTCCSGRACQRSPRRRTCSTQSGCPPLLKDRGYERETED